MTLSKDEVNTLEKAIKGYDFPCVYYDYLDNQRVEHSNMRPVEEYLKKSLTSGNSELVNNGLSNVLYWGYARVGYREKRIRIFRNQVTKGQLDDAALLFADIREDCLKEIKRIRLPQFSGMSFITKIRMFLDPTNYVVLDRQIIKMKGKQLNNLLDNITFGNRETQIRITKNNVDIYVNWCNKCKEISHSYFGDKYRAVDIERGFFKLIESGRVEEAAKILSNA